MLQQKESVMNKFSMSVAELRQSYRKYTRSNREDWADLGFRNITCFVHDDERAVVLAELEVRKFEAMVAMAENPKTGDDKLQLMSRRNMTALPAPGDLSLLKKEVAVSTVRQELEGLIDIAQNYIKRYRGIEANYDKVEDERKRIVMAAKAVAYSGACGAQLRLVRELLKAAPLKDDTIFGMREVEP
jgi:hypothetical protein